jgi:3-phosphoshikimate 1-carboxyvinyltransferase
MLRFKAPASFSSEYEPPPSKSYTHRALVASSLADGVSTLENPLISDDTLATVGALRALGIRLRMRGKAISVRPGALRAPGDVLNCRGSGTTMRFMISLASLAESGYTVLTGGARLRERPVGPLLGALSRLGVYAISTRGNGLPPVIVRGGGMPGGAAEISASESSQYVSSILLSAPGSRDGVELHVAAMVSRTYVDATLAVMRAFGAEFTREGYVSFRVEPSGYRATEFSIPGDYSSASYMMSLVAAVGGTLTVRGLGDLPQADVEITRILEAMGAGIRRDGESVIVESNGELRGGTFNIGDSPDLLPIVAALGLLAHGRTRLEGIAHTRLKESDRPMVLAEEIRRIGGIAEVGDDWMEVEAPRSPRAVVIDDHGDHRIFMAFAVASAAFGGAFALAPSTSYRKSYPGFLRDIAALGVEIW